MTYSPVVDPCVPGHADPVADPAVRRSGFGGSDIAALIGHSPWRSPNDVDLEKMGLSAPLIPTEAMEWGTILEAPVLAKYFRTNAEKGYRPSPKARLRCEHGFQRTFRRPDRAYMFVHPDGEVRRKKGEPFRGVEVKTTSAWLKEEWGEPGTDQIPGYYGLQAMHEMAVMGWDCVDFPVLIGGNTYREYTVWRDDETIEKLLLIVDREWARIQRGEYADVDGSAGSDRMLALRFPKDNGEYVAATDEQAEMARQYLVLKGEESRVKEELGELEQRIQVTMGEVKALSGADFKVTWSTVAGSTKWKQAAEALRVHVTDAGWQQVLAAAKGSDSRRFSVVAKDDNT